MGGLLTHLSIGLAGFIIGTFVFNNYKYGLSFILGSLIPDLLDFGIAGIKQGSLNPAVIMTNPLFHPLAVFGHTFWHWLIIGLVIIAFMLILYNRKVITKKTYKVSFFTLLFFLTAIAIHLIIDALIIETSYWI
jgi:hypothetical protein